MTTGCNLAGHTKEGYGSKGCFANDDDDDDVICKVNGANSMIVQ
jgi:hypothetical protein